MWSSSEITGTNPGSSPPSRSEKIILTTWLRNKIFRKLSRVSKDEAFSEGIEDDILVPQGLMESLHSALEGQDFMLYFQGVK